MPNRHNTPKNTIVSFVLTSLTVLLKPQTQGFSEEDTYLCDSRYSARGKNIAKLKGATHMNFEVSMKGDSDNTHEIRAQAP